MREYNVKTTKNIKGFAFACTATYSNDKGRIRYMLEGHHDGELVMLLTGDEYGLIIDRGFSTGRRITTTKEVIKSIDALIAKAEAIASKEWAF